MRTIDFKTGPGAASGDSFRVSDGDPITLADHAIFSADYGREGNDLILSAPGQPDLRLVDYFLQDTPPDLVAGNGAVLRGELAARLAGPIMPGQYAQVGGDAGTDPIGQVEVLEGLAWAERSDGTRVQLEVGSKIYENDVLITEGGKLSVTFADGTIFTLAADSRMVIDSLVYDAEAEDGNGGAFSLIEGGFVFIAGEVAKTGGMDVTTPTATMGIRGTTVLVEITTVDGVSTVEVSLNTDPDGGQGAFELRDLNGNLIAFIDSTDTKWIVSPIEGETREVVRTADDLADDQTLLLDAVRAYALAFERVDAGGTFVELVSNPSSGSNGPQVDDDSGTLGNQSDPDNGPTTPPGTTGNGTGDAPTPTPPVPTQSGEDETPANTAPDARNDVRTLQEDGSITGNVLSNDSDADGDDLSVIINTQPKHGTLTIDDAGNYSYSPSANYNGPDSFTYTVSDGNGGTDTATVTFTVNAVQDAPVATDDVGTLIEDGAPITINVLDNDSDIDGDPLSVIDWSGFDEEGPWSPGENGTITYTPPPDFNGTDTITYTVSDGNGNTDTATLTVTVTPAADAPVADDQAIETAEDTPITIFPSFEEVDVDGDMVSIIAFSQGTHGAVSEDGEGGFLYTPGDDYNGSDTFTYTVSDGNGLTDTATVSVTVTPVNDDPVATPESLTVAEDGSAVVYPSFDGTDVDGDDLFISDFGQGANGVVTTDLEGGLVYTPNADFHGTDSFTYTVSDGNGGTATETVSVTVTPVNDDPVATPDSLTVAEDGSAVVYPSFDGTDVDGDDVFISDFGQGANGAVTTDLEGGLVYTPNADFHGTDSFTYTVSDGNGGTATETVSVTVTPVNDDPVAQDSALEVEADTPATGTVAATDVDGDTLSYSVLTGPAHGSITLGANGQYSYTPDEGFTGFDSFEMLIADGNGGTDTATVTLEVADEEFALNENQSRSLALSEDPVGDAPAGNLHLGLGEVTGNTINLSFALDASGSVGSTGWTNIETAIYNAINQLADQFDGSATTVNVQIIQYGAGVYEDLRYELTDPQLLTAIDALVFESGSRTDWHLAMDSAHAFFSGQDVNDTNVFYFVTDGVPSGTAWTTSLATLNNAAYDVDIQAFGIGNGFNTSQLQQVDSDGTPTAVTDSAALLGAIQDSPLFAAQLVELSLSLVADGTNHGEIADETSPALTSDGLNFDLPLAEIAGIGDLLGEENLFSASATFDLDGDLNTTGDRITINSFERIAKKGEAQDLTGTDKSDLLLGSDEDDVISGGDGNDIVLGFGGDDVLIAGLGDNLFNGGEGRDLLELATGAASDLIETLADSDIEAIDLSNSIADTLFLDATDVINLSSTADTDLELLLNEALGESATILGEVGDSVTLMPEGLGNWEAAATGVDDGKGNTLDIYQFVEGGVVMATLGIDDDVTVNIPVAS